VWTEEEFRALRENFAFKSLNEMKTILPNRSKFAIEAKAYYLDLHKNPATYKRIKRQAPYNRKDGYIWTSKENILLKKVYSKSTRLELIKLFANRTYRAVRAKASRLGIEKDEEVRRKQISQNNSMKKARFRKRVALSKLGKKRPEITGKPRPDFARILKRWAKDPEFIKRRMKTLIKRPTKPENLLIHLCRRHSLPFRYVGDGALLIGTRNPDFIHSQGQKKVIEVFGRYWHDLECNSNIRPKQTYEATMKYYAKAGYHCLILWDDELENERLTVRKIEDVS
jgi:G:T-mismatch repair DNA endonuclease (very short patch repair protein)